jgi:MSHA biogenesis protein MshP
MSLVAALFLIVALAALGMFVVRIDTSQQQGINLALLETRALAAAHAGVELAANRALVGNICTNTALNLTEGSLAGFRVRIWCASTSHLIGGTPRRVFEIRARSQWSVYGRPDYVSRQLIRKVTNAP